MGWVKQTYDWRWVKQTYGWIMNNGKYLIAEIKTNYIINKLSLTIYCDPRTGKPWKSMKQAKEWLDEAISNL
jgi:hypothetical protein